MATMYPPEIPPEVKSSAERKIFELIRMDLGNEWSALHSLGLTSHRTKPWAEIDFVLIGPQGVFCLEVKGGRIARRDGRYLFTDRNDVTTVKDQGPFEQVGPAAAALYRYVVGMNDRLRQTAVGYGVVTPDIEFKITGPDIEPRVIFDERDLGRSFEVYLRRIAEYWHERLEAQGKQIELLSHAGCKSVLDCLRGDFDLRPSLRSRIGKVNEELLRLTNEQYGVLDGLTENERVIVRGGAGTGKTLLALEEARRQAAAGKKVFLCCFNSALGSDLGKAVSDLPGVTAGHLHSFMAGQVSQAGLRDRLPSAQDSDLFQVFYPELSLEALLATGELGSFDSVIVDEAQDLLLESYLDVFDALLKGGLASGSWRFFLDPSQDLFMGTSPAGLQRLVRTGAARFVLSINCRNSAPIATMTQVVSGVPILETLKAHGPDVAVHWYGNENEQRREISNAVNRLLGEHVDPRDIVVIGNRRLINGGLKDGLIKVPFALKDSSDIRDAERVIKYSTVQAFKGLEANAVLVVDVNDLESRDCLFNLYVACTRARAYMELFISKNVEKQYRQRAFEFGESLARRQSATRSQ